GALPHGEHPIVGNWRGIRYDDVGGWKRRVDALVGGPEFFGDTAVDLPRLRAAYDALPADRILATARRYHASCIVATTAYPFPVLHRVGATRIYRVPGAAT